MDAMPVVEEIRMAIGMLMISRDKMKKHWKGWVQKSSYWKT